MKVITKEMIEQNEVKRQEIERKLRSNEPLNSEEIWMMGDQMKLDELPAYPVCFDMYYRRLYFPYKEGSDPFGEELSEGHLFNFQSLVTNWGMHINEKYPAGSLAAASQKETLKEIVSLEREWKIKGNVSIEEKDETFFELLAWSKFRYVLARRIFELDIKAEYYNLFLNGIEIRFDYESAIHILTRHFAHGMKPYSSKKDHFYGVFAYNELHLDFERIFSAINKSGVYKSNSVEEITFRFKGVIYRIYTNCIDSTNNVYRISTFFPVSSPAILNGLGQNYKEVNISVELSVFVKLEV